MEKNLRNCHSTFCGASKLMPGYSIGPPEAKSAVDKNWGNASRLASRTQFDKSFRRLETPIGYGTRTD